MSDQHQREALVAAIHNTPPMIVLAVAGGGNAAITDLLDVPGASRTILEVRVPYAETAMIDFLGGEVPDGAVSQRTAEAMARACLLRAQFLAPDQEVVLGVACTASLASDRPKRGGHRAHVAIASTDGISHHLVSIVKGALDRRGEDRVVADAILRALAVACGLQPLA